jgi:hypothetical protein
MRTGLDRSDIPGTEKRLALLSTNEVHFPIWDLRFHFRNNRWLAGFQDGQLSQSGILQRDLFVAGEDENDESQRLENRFEHDAVL